MSPRPGLFLRAGQSIDGVAQCLSNKVYSLSVWCAPSAVLSCSFQREIAHLTFDGPRIRSRRALLHGLFSDFGEHSAEKHIAQGGIRHLEKRYRRLDDHDRCSETEPVRRDIYQQSRRM